MATSTTPSSAQSVQASVLRRGARVVLAVYWPALAIVTHWPRLVVEIESFPPGVIDKLIHFGMYGGLVWLLIHAVLFGETRCGNIITSGLVVCGYAFIDELSQPLAPFGRTFDLADLIADLAGCMVMAAAIWAWPGVTRSGKTSAAAVDRGAFVGQAIVVGLFTFVSRITGLLRESALGMVFGVSGVSSAFMIGFIVPNLFRRLFGEGALSSAFIPIYSSQLRRDPAAARRLASACVALLFTVLGGVVVIGELVFWAMLTGGQWSADASLAIRLAMTMLPYMPLVCVVALLGGILQVHGRFGSTAATPILLNLVMIGGIYLCLGGTTEPRTSIFVVAICVLVAGVVQLIWQIVATTTTSPLTTSLRGTAGPLRSMAWTMLPMIMALSVFQLNTLLDVLIAFYFSPKAGGGAMMNILGWQVNYPIRSEGAAAALVFAQRLYQFPLGVFGIAIATAIFPALSRAAAKKADEGHDSAKSDGLREILQRGLRLAVFIGLPASVGMILVRVPLTRIIFEYGRVEEKDVLLIAVVLFGYATSVWAYSVVHVLTRAFYAVKDVHTPLRISVAMVSCNFCLNLTWIWFLGVSGLAWSTAACAVVQVIFLLRAVSRHVKSPVDRTVRRSWLKSAIMTLVMGVVLCPIVFRVDVYAITKFQAGLLLVAMVTTGVCIVGFVAWRTKSEELTWLLNRNGA